jgi:hypothetical protein
MWLVFAHPNEAAAAGDLESSLSPVEVGAFSRRPGSRLSFSFRGTQGSDGVSWQAE